MKEEKELRSYIRTEALIDDYKDEYINVRREMYRLITALVRAVREECAKVAEGEMQKGSNLAILTHNTSCSQVAAAIRGKK